MDQKGRPFKPIRIKIISLGNAGVGKSCIIKRYYEKRFVSKYLATIGIDYGITRLEVAGRQVSVNIFDMSGDFAFSEVRNEFYSGTQGAILVFDVTDAVSFQSLDTWMDEMEHQMKSTSDFARVVFVVCGNKVDQAKRVVGESEARLWADLRGLPYFETSAATGVGIQEAFQTLFRHVVRAAISPGGSDFSGLPQTFPKTREEAISLIKGGEDDFSKLGVRRGASSEEINRAYRRLAVLLHPDKSELPGTEEAFKELAGVKANLLQASSTEV